MDSSYARPHIFCLAALATCTPKDLGSDETGGTTIVTTGVTDELPTGGADDGPPRACERPVEWSVRFGGPTSDTVQALAVNPAGDIFLGLDLRNIDDVAPVKFGAFEVLPGIESNIVIARLTTDGEVAWVKQFSGPGDEYLWTLAACGDGVVFQAQAEPGTVDLGGGKISERVFFAALDGDGQHRWTHPVPTASEETWLLVVDMACDAGGNLAFTGSHEYGAVDLGGGPLVTNDGYVARFDADGAFLWSRDFGAENSRGYGVAYTPAGDIVVTAGFDGTVDLGGGPIDEEDGNILLAKLDATGGHVWSAAVGSSGAAADAIAVDSGGQIAFGGTFRDALSLGEDSFVNANPFHEEDDGTYYDGFVALADPGGALQWALQLGSDHDDDVDQINFDVHDRMVVSGLVDDAFTVQVYEGSQVAWSWCAPGLRQVYAAPSGEDAVILAPWVVEKDLDLGAGALPGFGGSDIVVAKIRP